MRLGSSSPLRFREGFAFALVLAAALVGCGRQNNNPHRLEGGGGQGFRAACADDLQKFCANDTRKRRCLQSNYTQLSDSCKSALGEFHAGGGNGMRAVCAADIQKYCAGDNKVRRCLRNNLENLSPGCKTAVSERHRASPNNTGDDNDND
jgi:hypothetical protein